MIHNHEVAGSIPAPATEAETSYRDVARFFICLQNVISSSVPDDSKKGEHISRRAPLL